MAEPWEWEEQDLINLIVRQAEEGTELDFKRCAAIDLSDREKTKRDMSKDVSAFANAAGGALLYGMLEEDHVAHEIDAGYDPDEVTREWIEQVINSNVHPRVPGVKVKTIQLTQKSPGRVAYVAWIPRGSTAHQANDKRYYRRYGTECLAMEDYEIRDVMNRAESPDMQLQFLVEGRQEGLVNFERRDGKTCSPSIEIWLANHGDAGMAEHCQCQLFLPSHLEVNAIDHHITIAGRLHRQLSPFMSDSYISGKGPRDELSYLEVRLGADDGPTFGGERRPLATLSFCYSSTVERDESLYLIWRVRAPMMRARIGCLVFDYRMRDWHMNPVSLEWLEDRDVAVSLAD